MPERHYMKHYNVTFSNVAISVLYKRMCEQDACLLLDCPQRCAVLKTDPYMQVGTDVKTHVYPQCQHRCFICVGHQ